MISNVQIAVFPVCESICGRGMVGWVFGYLCVYVCVEGQGNIFINQSSGNVKQDILKSSIARNNARFVFFFNPNRFLRIKSFKKIS
jgi:hypothetical protein